MTVSAGASGAIFGLYGALLSFLLVERKTLPAGAGKQIAMRASSFLAFNLIYGLVDGTVDLSAHLGGFVMGCLAGSVLARPHASGTGRLPLGRTISAGLAGSAILVLSSAALPKLNEQDAAWYRRIMTGSEVKAPNKGHVIYTGKATESEAKNLSQGLQQKGLFKAPGYIVFLSRDSTGASIYLPLGKDESTYQPASGKASTSVDGRTIVDPKDKPAPPLPWNDPKIVTDLRFIGVSIAPSVGGVPIKILILNNKGELRKTIEIGEHELPIGMSGRIWFSGSVTRKEAMDFGDATQESGFFGRPGGLAIISRGPEGTAVSFAVKDGAWDKPSVLLGFHIIAKKIADSVGGLPIKINLIDSAFQTRTTFVVE